jgi:hypothetical protein
MKIIKKVDTSTWSYKHTCDTCDTELEVEKSDVKYQYFEGYGKDPDWDEWKAICPICFTAFNVPLENIPRAVRVEIRNK